MKINKKQSAIDFKKTNTLKDLSYFYSLNKNKKNSKEYKNSIKIKSKNNSFSMLSTKEDIFIINETITEHSEKSLMNNKYKCFLGKDIVDKIYYCPEDNVIILNFEEANKIGLMLLELLRTEAEIIQYDILFKQISKKFEDELLSTQKERESFINEYF